MKTQLRTFFLTIFASLLLLSTINTPVHAKVTWHAPQEVSQGRAFVISFTDDEPFKGTLIWRKKNIPFQASSLSQSGNYETQVMLGMPMDAKGKLDLTYTLKQNKKNEQKGQTLIEVMPVKWIAQQLSVEPKYVNYPKETLDRITKEREKRAPLMANIDPVPTWELPFLRPVKGGISGSFAERRVFNNEPRSPHTGTDMRGATGTPIYSLADGEVVLAENHYFSGNMVIIDHGQGVMSLYAHLSKFTAKVGDKIKKGQEVGKVGATGRVTGPHLHLGVYVQGVPVDPIPLMTAPLAIVGGPTPIQPRPQTNSQKNK